MKVLVALFVLIAVVEFGDAKRVPNRGPSNAGTRNSVVVSNPLGAGNPTPILFHLPAKQCYKLYLPLQTIVPGICSSISENEKENQGQVEKDFTPCTKVIAWR
ncbi:hypothetical protein TNCV_2729131 [Trichonephila clavipes]|nr:hypothetical protein TNCV_2729131 [Trichonephila clavipes]